MLNIQIIRFTFVIHPTKINIEMEADVRPDESNSHFIVSNFRTSRHGAASVLPDIRIRKKSQSWVHIDSEKETDLSRAVGEAIQAQLVGHTLQVPGL